MKYNPVLIVFLCLLTFSCSVDADLVSAVQQIEASNNNDDIVESDNNSDDSSEEDVDTPEGDSEEGVNDLNDSMIDNQSSASPLVGVWVMVDVVFEEDPNDTSLNLADEVVDRLVAEDCFLVTFTFNEDGTATSQNSINFLEINAGPTGLVVPCPENSDDRAGTWSLEGDQLLFVYDNGSEETLTIVLDEDSLTFAGEDINAANYSDADAVFAR